MKLNLITSMGHIQKSQAIRQSLLSNPSLYIVNSILSPKHDSNHVMTLFKTFPSTAPSIQRSNLNISKALKFFLLLLFPTTAVLYIPCPLIPRPQRFSLGTLGPFDYSMTQVILST